MSLQPFPTGDRHNTLDPRLVPHLPYDLEYRIEDHEPLAEWPLGRSVVGWGAVLFVTLLTSFLWLNIVTVWIVIVSGALSMAYVNRYILPSILFIAFAPAVAFFSIGFCLLALPVVFVLVIRLGEQIAHQYALYATANPRAVNRLRWRREFAEAGPSAYVAAVLAPWMSFLLLTPFVPDVPASHVVLALYIVAALMGVLGVCVIVQALAQPRSVPAFGAALRHFLDYGRPDAPPWAFRSPYGHKVARRARFQFHLLAFWGVVMWAAGHFPWAVVARALSPEAQRKYEAMAQIGSAWMLTHAFHDASGFADLLLSVASWLTLPPLAFFGLLYVTTASRVTRYYLAFEAPDATAIDRSITAIAGYQDRVRQSAVAELRDTILLGEQTWPDD